MKLRNEKLIEAKNIAQTMEQHVTQMTPTSSTPYEMRSIANIYQLSCNDLGTLPSAGFKYEEREEQQEQIATQELQKIQPNTPEPCRTRPCLKRKRVATRTLHYVGKSGSLTTLENKAKLFHEHCKYAYHTRNLIRVAEGIFSELQSTKNDQVSQKKMRKGVHQSWKEIPKTSDLNAMKEWRILLEEDSHLDKGNEPLRDLVSVFIQNVRGVQGDRCYSEWKGSVLDSVIGAFLAQNASDQLSSLAFMSLAARFPLNNNFSGAVDCLHWNAVRQAKARDVSKAISLRGMHNRLANRIKALLNWLDKEHNGLNLEVLRDFAPEIIMKFLQKFTGIGVKSVECVRLLALKQKAFPVDTHVARVAIRLGWIPLPPPLYKLQTCVSERYRRIIKLIHQYLWSRLCELDHGTLYELHCQMITFGKVFCTNNNPKCSVCPMKENCKYYKSRAQRNNQEKTEKRKSCNVTKPCTSTCLGNDIEEISYNTRSRKPNADISFVSPKMSNKRLDRRTKHTVYELPDKHPLLVNMNTRVVEDPSPYLLVVWEPGELINHSKSDQSDDSNKGKSDLSCLLPLEGTIMIPCRTALKGSFPLNGTFFQTNEMFADHKTSEYRLKVSRKCLPWLHKKVLYCGTSLTEIVRGLSGEDISGCFKEGYICTRGFDQETGLPKPLHDRFQFSPSS